MDVRKIHFDEHDKKEALKQIVEAVDAFAPTLEQYANMPAGYTAAQLRQRLGEVADGIKGPVDSKLPKKKSKALRVTEFDDDVERRAARAIAAVSRAYDKAPPPARRSRGKKQPGICKYFRHNGSCRFGEKCIFSHGDAHGVEHKNPYAVLADLADADEEDHMVAAVLRFWDGEGQQPALQLYLKRWSDRRPKEDGDKESDGGVPGEYE